MAPSGRTGGDGVFDLQLLFFLKMCGTYTANHLKKNHEVSAAMTLRSKMITATAVVTTSIFLLLAVVTLGYFERKQYQTIIAQQQATVSFTAGEIDATLQNVKELLHASAKVFPLEALQSPEQASLFLQSRTGLHKQFNRHLVLLNLNGELIAESRSLPSHRRKQYRDDQFFKETLATLKPQISDPLPCCLENGEYNIIFSAPITDGQGRLQAVLAGAFSLSSENILTRFSKVSTGEGSFIRLVSSRFQIIIHSQPELVMQQVAPGIRPLFEDALNGFSGTRAGIGRNQDRLYTSVSRLKSINWVLASSYPQETILQPIKTMRIIFAAAIAVSLAALIAIISIYMGYLSRPLRAFTRHLQELPSKTGADRLFTSTSHDELGQMATTFNTLITTLDQQTEELHLQNVSLEQEIAERQKLQEALQHEQRELAALNETLTRRVAEEVELNREKDQQLLQQERLVVMGELLSALSHQWRQPLNNVSLLIQQLQLQQAEGELTRETMASFSHDSLKMLSSLSRTLEGFRNLFQADRELISFDPVIRTEEVTQLVRPGFEANGIRLVYHGEGATTVEGHYNEFTRALMTILGNAREVLLSRPVADPLVEVRCSAREGHAVVTIQDNGGGIPQEVINRIFDPYYTTKFMSQGTGLGLFMCKTVIERVMHGSLTVRNTEQGAEFTITL